MTDSHFHQGYIAGLKFAAEMLELNSQHEAAKQVQDLIETMTTITV